MQQGMTLTTGVRSNRDRLLEMLAWVMLTWCLFPALRHVGLWGMHAQRGWDVPILRILDQGVGPSYGVLGPKVTLGPAFTNVSRFLRTCEFYVDHPGSVALVALWLGPARIGRYRPILISVAFIVLALRLVLALVEFADRFVEPGITSGFGRYYPSYVVSRLAGLPLLIAGICVFRHSRRTVCNSRTQGANDESDMPMLGGQAWAALAVAIGIETLLAVGFPFSTVELVAEIRKGTHTMAYIIAFAGTHVCIISALLGLAVVRRSRKRSLAATVKSVRLAGYCVAAGGIIGVLCDGVHWGLRGSSGGWIGWGISSLSVAMRPAAVLFVMHRAATRIMRTCEGYCECGYNLSGNMSGRCPECGAPVVTRMAAGSRAET